MLEDDDADVGGLVPLRYGVMYVGRFDGYFFEECARPCVR